MFSTISGHIWILTFVFFLLYRLYIVLYNLCLHPLRKVPGPWLWSISWIPKVWRNNVIGTHWSHLKTLHENYGPVVRVGPDEVSFTSAAAWDDMQGRRGSRSAGFERDPNFFIVTQIDQRDSLLSPVKEEHNMIRRMMLPAFADRAMVRQEAILLEWADRFLQSLHRRKGESIDIAETYHWTTFDMMGDLAFGESFGCLENDRTHYFLDLVTKALPYLSVLHILLRFDMTRLLYTTATRLPWMQSWMDTLDFAADVAEKRFQRRGEAREDIMTIIWDNAQERKEKLSRRQAAQLANILCTVGTETTSTALAGITYWLLKTPHAYAALATELRSLTEDELTIRKLAVLPYLNACVTEGMRKHTAVAGPTPRVSPKGGAWVDGYFIPEGTVVGIPQWAAANVTSNFTKPEYFLPERWLPEGREEFADDNKKAFNPFGKGTSDCLGKQLAMTEMRLVIAKLFYHFDLVLKPESGQWLCHKDARSRLFWNKQSLWVDVRPRAT